MRCDIAIIGAGPGGYTAAIRAAQLHKKVVLIEKDEVGGTCLNHGCIPTKALIASTNLLAKIKNASQFAIKADNPSIDLVKLMERKDIIISKLRKGLLYLFKENKIDLIKGKGILKDCNTIEVSGEDKKTISASKIILATGSTIQPVPDIAIDEKSIFSSNGILKIESVPRNIAIVGAGAIGIEFACIFNELGSKVSIFELQHQILPNEDAEVAKALEQSLIKRGIEIKLGESLKNTAEYEVILIAAGRRMNTEGFKDAGVDIQKGKVVVNEKMETNIMGVYAVGDIAGNYMFAHAAAREGLVAAENAFGGNMKMDYLAVPRCIYSHPEVASVGHSEEEAKKFHGHVKVGKYPLMASSKALIEDEREGFVKIITDPSDKVIGVTIIGVNATEIIGEATLAVSKGLKIEDLINTIHAHPTIHESIYEAAENVFKRSISIINK